MQDGRELGGSDGPLLLRCPLPVPFFLPLHRDRSLDVGMGVVVFEGEVLELEGVDVLHLRVEAHGGERARVAGELKLGLLDVVRVEVEVAEGVHELARLVVEDLVKRA